MADILIIDSAYRYRSLVRLFLEGIGYRVREASGIRDAAALLLDKTPDLAIFGINLSKPEDRHSLLTFQKMEWDVPAIVLFSGDSTRKADYLGSLERVESIKVLDQPTRAYRLLAMVKAMLTSPGELLEGGHHFGP